MARTGGEWIKTVGGYIKTAYDNGVNVLINGENRYLNFNLSSGEAGYGIRDNNGTMEFKNADGSWTALGGGGGGATQEEVEDIVAGLLAGADGVTVTYDDVGNVLTISLTDEAYTSAEKTKVGYISVTQAVDLDAIEARVNQLDAAVVLVGTWDASAGTFPTSTNAGESWIISVEGTVDGVEFKVGDRIIAITDGASTTVYAANWLKLDYTDRVSSVAGKVGAVTLDKNDVGLGNVDNTTDLNKPISTATQAALDEAERLSIAYAVAL